MQNGSCGKLDTTKESKDCGKFFFATWIIGSDHM